MGTTHKLGSRILSAYMQVPRCCCEKIMQNYIAIVSLVRYYLMILVMQIILYYTCNAFLYFQPVGSLQEGKHDGK